LTCSDPLRLLHLHEDSQLFVEMQCRWQLLGPASLEFLGSAVPALTPTERDHLEHGVRVVLPLGKAGELRVGAKQSWETAPDPFPWTNHLQFRLDSGLKW
jgi:hypothetical protein